MGPHERLRRGGRAVEGTSLENWQRRKAFVGSNPTLSATIRRVRLLAVAVGDLPFPLASSRSGLAPFRLYRYGGKTALGYFALGGNYEIDGVGNLVFASASRPLLSQHARWKYRSAN
jgi:hypothetical protein